MGLPRGIFGLNIVSSYTVSTWILPYIRAAQWPYQRRQLSDKLGKGRPPRKRQHKAMLDGSGEEDGKGITDSIYRSHAINLIWTPHYMIYIPKVRDTCDFKGIVSFPTLDETLPPRTNTSYRYLSAQKLWMQHGVRTVVLYTIAQRFPGSAEDHIRVRNLDLGRLETSGPEPVKLKLSCK